MYLYLTLHDLHIYVDIKPENVLFDSCEDDARLKIIDFGLSRGNVCDIYCTASMTMTNH